MKSRDPIRRREFLSTLTAVSLSLPLGQLFSARLGDDKRKIPQDVCIFSKHLQFLPDYTAMAEVAAEIGFDGIDLTVRPGGHVLPENVEKDLPRAITAAGNAGLKVPMIVTKITGAEESSAELILKTAREQGIKFYRMGYFEYDDKIGVEKSLERIKTKIAGLIELNKKYEINGAYQNHAGDRVGGPVWDLWWLIRSFDPQWIGCQYDIRHATVEGTYSWPLAVELLSPYIKTTAIKDYYWVKANGNWKIQNCPLGEGMVDFNRYFQYCRQVGISGPVSLHIEYDFYDEGDPLPTKRLKAIKAMKKDLTALRGMLNR